MCDYSCIQIAKAFGASEVIAVDVLDEKLTNAKLLGATHTVNAKNEDAVERIKVCIAITLTLLLLFFTFT
jgi:Zn-dependent alcohol dehydrogenase